VGTGDSAASPAPPQPTRTSLATRRRQTSPPPLHALGMQTQLRWEQPPVSEGCELERSKSPRGHLEAAAASAGLGLEPCSSPARDGYGDAREQQLQEGGEEEVSVVVV